MKLSKKVVVICLLSVLMIEQSALAVDVSPKIMNETVKQSGKAIWGTASGAFNVLFVLLILAGVKEVKKKVREAEVAKRPITNQDIAKWAWGAAKNLGSQPVVYASVAGNLISGAGVAEPLTRLLSVAAEKAQFRTQVVQSLQAGIVAVIANIGFQVGDEMWREARAGLEEREEYKRAGEVSTLLAGMKDLVAGADTLESRTVSHLAQNVWRRLVKENRGKRRLLGNVWRKRIANGDFVAPLATMTIGTWLAIRILGKASGKTGMLIGIASGLASNLIPEDLRNAVTNTITWGRRSFNSHQFTACLGDVVSGSIQSGRQDNIEALHERIQSCKSLRSQLVSIQIETLHRNYSRLQQLMREHQMAQEVNNQVDAIKIHTQLETNRQLIREAIQYIRELYGQQIDVFVEAQTFSKRGSSQLLGCEVSHLKRVIALLNSILTALEPTFLDHRLGDFDITALEKFYEDGFDEDEFIRHIYPQQPLAECANLPDAAVEQVK